MMEGHRRILVVEDDPETAGQLVEQLTTSGYRVDLAVDGDEALSRGAAGRLRGDHDRPHASGHRRHHGHPATARRWHCHARS